jgi:hypothetical protein
LKGLSGFVGSAAFLARASAAMLAAKDRIAALEGCDLRHSPAATAAAAQTAPTSDGSSRISSRQQNRAPHVQDSGEVFERVPERTAGEFCGHRENADAKCEAGRGLG